MQKRKKMKRHIVIFILIIFSSSSLLSPLFVDGINCPTDHFCLEDGRKILCDGKKCPGSCAKGEYGNSTLNCIKCANGKYGPTMYESIAQWSGNPCPYITSTCPKGHYCNNNSVPTPCATGKYGNAEGQVTETTACTNNCPAEKYGTRPGQASELDACKCNPDSWGTETCFRCSLVNICLGGTDCIEGRRDFACQLCQYKWYSPDNGITCVPCPDNDYAAVTTACACLAFAFFGIYKLLDKSKGREGGGNKMRKEGAIQSTGNNKIKRSRSQSEFKNGATKNGSKGEGIKHSTGALISIFATHAIVFSFQLPTIEFLFLPAEFREWLIFVLKIFTINITDLLTSPECTLNLGIYSRFWLNMCLPVILIFFIMLWRLALRFNIPLKLALLEGLAIMGISLIGYFFWNVVPIYFTPLLTGLLLLITPTLKSRFQKTMTKKRMRMVNNYVVGVFSYIWYISLYAVTLRNIMILFDCTLQDDGSLTLDMQPLEKCTSYDYKIHRILCILLPIPFYILYGLPRVELFESIMAYCNYTEIEDKHLPVGRNASLGTVTIIYVIVFSYSVMQFLLMIVTNVLFALFEIPPGWDYGITFMRSPPVKNTNKVTPLHFMKSLGITDIDLRNLPLMFFVSIYSFIDGPKHLRSRIEKVPFVIGMVIYLVTLGAPIFVGRYGSGDLIDLAKLGSVPIFGCFGHMIILAFTILFWILATTIGMLNGEIFFNDNTGKLTWCVPSVPTYEEYKEEYEMMQIQVPIHVKPTPDGRWIQVTVPPGVSDGQIMKDQCTPLKIISMQIQVPMNVKPGMVFQATTPDGQRIQVKVPPGVYGGQTMEVQYTLVNLIGPLFDYLFLTIIFVVPALLRTIVMIIVTTLLVCPFILLYNLGSMFQKFCKGFMSCIQQKSLQKSLQHISDLKQCHNYNPVSNEPCYNCNACDIRTRYSWMVEKYHPDCYYWEMVILVRKLLIAMPVLFLTTRHVENFITQIGINICFLVLTIYFQPYLTDEEYLQRVFY